MQFENLKEAILVKRYKRFLVDFYFKDNPNKILTAHCPNSGALPNLMPNNIIYVSNSTNNTAKLPFVMQLIKQKENLICINTMLANKIIYNALLEQKIECLKEYTNIKPEYKYLNSRFDFYLTQTNLPNVLLEVKSVSLSRKNALAEFPDCKTTRGKKHLLDLIEASKNGFKTIMLYLIMVENITQFELAQDIDKEYFNTANLAKQNNVNFLAYTCNISCNSITLKESLKI